MDNVSIIGIDISKRSFQLQHGATASGEPVLRGKLSRVGRAEVPRFRGRRAGW